MQKGRVNKHRQHYSTYLTTQTRLAHYNGTSVNGLTWKVVTVRKVQMSQKKKIFTWTVRPVARELIAFAALWVGLLLRRTRRFFPSNGRGHRQYLLHLPTKGWPGWLGVGGWLNTKMVYPRTVTYPSTNPGRYRTTSLMCAMPLSLSQTATVVRCHTGELTVTTTFIATVITKKSHVVSYVNFPMPHNLRGTVYQLTFRTYLTPQLSRNV